MKFCAPLFSSLLLFSISSFSQNQAPVITNTSAVVDWGQQVIHIRYDVFDAESDNLEITFKVSDDNGKTFFYSTAVTSGDVGFPVLPGISKNILWDYNDSVVDFTNFIFLVEANDRQLVDIHDIVSQVDSGRLYDNVSFMQGVRHRTTGPINLQNTRDSIFHRFEVFEMSPWIQSFNFGTYSGQNIIGKLPGMIDEDTVYIVDAHYDGVAGGPAADDNASGTAGVFEAARILSQYSFDKTICFIGFDLEEEGLKGSIAYVTSAILPQEFVDGVLNFEMIGYYSDSANSQSVPAGFNQLFPAAYALLQADNFRGNFITSVGNTNSNSLNASFVSNAQTYVPQLKVLDLSVPGNGSIAQDFRRSDHAPFWDVNRKALMLTDGANFRNANYHTANDVKDSLDFGFMTNVVKATVATVAALANPRHSDVSRVQATNPVGLNDQRWNCAVLVNYKESSNSIQVRFLDCKPNKINYTLIDEQGRIVKEKMNLKVEGELEIKVATRLAKGIYFLQITNEKGQLFTSKILLN